MELPARIHWALATIRARRDDRVLEIGCGAGLAAQRVCERVTTGHVIAIDRSVTALARARRRNVAHIEAGRLTLVRAELAAFDPKKLAGSAGLFDTVFAINVNVFWTKPAGVERARIEALLAPGGQAWLFREEPSGRRSLLTCKRSRTRVVWS